MSRRPRPYRHNYRIPNVEFEKGFPDFATLRRPDKSIWSATKDFINDLKIKEKFKRKEIHKDIYRNKMLGIVNSLDNYLALLLRIGILEKAENNQFIKLYNIPEKLTTSQLQKLSNKNNWESWFTPASMLNKLCK